MFTQSDYTVKDVNGANLNVGSRVIAGKSFTGYYLWGEDEWNSPDVLVQIGDLGTVSEIVEDDVVYVAWDHTDVQATIVASDLISYSG